jgi:hypothetical protein
MSVGSLIGATPREPVAVREISRGVRDHPGPGGLGNDTDLDPKFGMTSLREC